MGARRLSTCALLVMLVVACRGDGAERTGVQLVQPATEPALTSTTALATPPSGAPGGGPTAQRTPSPTPLPSSTPATTAVPAGQGGATGGVDFRATRLVIPSLGIDTDVQSSQVVKDDSPPTPGCPPAPPGRETLTVPAQGVATPEVAIDGMEGTIWVFGHSRWEGRPGILFRLQDITRGDEVFVDGVDRGTGGPVGRHRFVVRGIYLTDIDSGAVLVGAEVPLRRTVKPTVILQTSAREDGEDKPWILDRQKVVARSQLMLDGNVDDPCKYLLLFVVAESA